MKKVPTEVTQGSNIGGYLVGAVGSDLVRGSLWEHCRKREKVCFRLIESFRLDKSFKIIKSNHHHHHHGH